MTALLPDLRTAESVRPVADPNAVMVQRLGLDSLEPISLDTLIENAELMHRTDRKYIAPVESVRALVDAIGGTHQILSIDGRRYTTYRTLYYDTANFTSVRAHIQRRRQRWKVRTRLYVEDQLSRVEVKTKDNRGNTAKVMGVSDPDFFGTLSPEDRSFVTTHLDAFPDTDVHDLAPTAEVRYTRATLSDLVAGTRVTLDWGLTMHMYDGDVWLDDRYVMIETKGPSALGLVDKTLRGIGVRPRSFSKYVSAAAALRDDIPANDFASLRANNVLHSRVRGL